MNINLTLLGQMITFVFFVWITKRFIWPPVIKALRDRQATIANGLTAAEEGRRTLENAKAQAKEIVAVGKEEVAQFLLHAQKQADAIMETARQQAHREGRRLIEQAHAEIAERVLQAKEGLRQEIAGIALKGAEKILERSVDPALHQDLLEKLAGQLQ